jgi:hypothetical protein
MPATTLEQEIAERQQFAGSENLPEGLKQAAVAALASSAPLGAFTQAVRSYGQASNWHTFRMGLLINRLRAWATQHEIPWQDSWIERGSTAPRPVQTSSIGEGASLREFFAALAESMYDTDLSRMNVPLDLVLRAWGRRGS